MLKAPGHQADDRRRCPVLRTRQGEAQLRMRRACTRRLQDLVAVGVGYRRAELDRRGSMLSPPARSGACGSGQSAWEAGGQTKARPGGQTARRGRRFLFRQERQSVSASRHLRVSNLDLAWVPSAKNPSPPGARGQATMFAPKISRSGAVCINPSARSGHLSSLLLPPPGPHSGLSWVPSSGLLL